jgi:AraC family transcriptional activator of pobA
MTSSSRRAPPDPAAVPQFALYGEQTPLPNAECVHVELIETRSRRHDWHIERHTHQGLYQVLFLMTGTVHATIGEALWECRGPVAITVHPSLVHGFAFSEQAQGYVLTVDQSVLFSTREHGGDLFSPLFVAPLALTLDGAVATQARQRIEALLVNLIDETAWPQHGHTLMLEWLARSVLLLLARVQAEQTVARASGHTDFALFSRFRAAVEEGYKNGEAVGHYAGLLHITPVRLNRLCLKLAGKSAFDLLHERLMLEACRKLTYAPSSVASIAYELGFQDPAYFGRAFKKHMGVTPRQFRERAAQPGADAVVAAR